MELTFRLTGPRGDNPLGFLSALGTLVSFEDMGKNPLLSWDDRLTPLLLVDLPKGEVAADGCAEKRNRDALLDDLTASLSKAGEQDITYGEKNLNFSSSKLRDISLSECNRVTFPERRVIDLITAYGTVNPKPSEEMLPSNWVLLNGQGHQDFLGTASNLMKECTKEHLRKALFGPWEDADIGRNISFRLDPREDRRHALMDKDPGGKDSQTILGANRLAFEALRLFPSYPVSGEIGLGVLAWDVKDERVRWPLWHSFVGVQTVKALLAHGLLWKVDDDMDARRSLLEKGVFSVIESRRINNGKYKNMTPGVTIWRSRDEQHGKGEKWSYI